MLGDIERNPHVSPNSPKCHHPTAGVAWFESCHDRPDFPLSSGRRAAATLGVFGTRARIRPEPKGICLIIAPWNYPLNLAFGPL
ncbi:hypothetical protein KXW38_008672, partial [Aspergillus fumigatus]